MNEGCYFVQNTAIIRRHNRECNMSYNPRHEMIDVLYPVLSENRKITEKINVRLRKNMEAKKKPFP